MSSLAVSASRCLAPWIDSCILRNPGRSVITRTSSTSYRLGGSIITPSFSPSRRISSSQISFGGHIVRNKCHASPTNNEEAPAKVAAANADSGAPTIFEKIIAREIPSTIVYEDEKVLAFRDINPQAPVHILIIPKSRDGLTQLSKAEERHGEILGQLLLAAKRVAVKEGLTDGFRVVINDGPAGCQSVYHLHLHVLGGRQLKWPPG